MGLLSFTSLSHHTLAISHTLCDSIFVIIIFPLLLRKLIQFKRLLEKRLRNTYATKNARKGLLSGVNLVLALVVYHVQHRRSTRETTYNNCLYAMSDQENTCKMLLTLESLRNDSDSRLSVMVSGLHVVPVSLQVVLVNMLVGRKSASTLLFDFNPNERKS